MTREQAEKLNMFQIVRWNLPEKYCQGWSAPYSGKLAVVTQKIIWNDGGEEIHLRFPEKRFMTNEFYSSIDDLMTDYNNGHDVTLNEGFDTDAECIDLVNY